MQLPNSGEESFTIPFKISNHNFEELVSIGYNADMVLHNRNKYLLAKSLLDLYEDSNFNMLIDETYKEYEIECIPFSLLFQDESFMASMNSQIEMGFLNTSLKSAQSISSAQELYESYIVEGNKQEPIVHLINPDVADFNLPPIISPGLEVEDDPKQGINDCIVAWFEDSNGDITKIILSEEEALNSKWPVYVISTIDKVDEPEIIAGLFKNSHLNISGIESGSGLIGTADVDYYNTREYMINHRYENSGRSEFQIITYYIEDEGDDYNPHADHYVFFNTFERDWWEGLKNFGKIYYPYYGIEEPLRISGKAGSSSNWYCNDPADYVWTNAVDFNYIVSHWALWYENSKGKIRLWRID